MRNLVYGVASCAVAAIFIIPHSSFIIRSDVGSDFAVSGLSGLGRSGAVRADFAF
ncbi:MAG TPA: hypothetical protein VGP72_22610 [Planctomycetota bacterium]|jgi:hypothetical protein